MVIPYSNQKKKKVESHPCSYCDKIFTDIGKLLEHEEIHEIHEQEVDKQRKLPYQ